MPRRSKDPRHKVKTGRGTLRKHAISKVWHFQFKAAHGRWKAVSTGHTDKNGALKWALGYSLNLTRAEQGVVKPDEKISNDPSRKAIDEYVKYVESQCKLNTYKTYRSSRDSLLAFPKMRPSLRRLDQFDRAKVLRYRNWLRRERGEGDDKR